MTIFALNSENQGVNQNFVSMAHEDLFEFFLKIIQKNLNLGIENSAFTHVKVDED